VQFRFCDEFEHGFGWITDEALGRVSHALVVDGGVWLTDALDWPEAIDRARELGEPRAVLHLLERHARGGGDVARRLGVPHVSVPETGAEPPFEAIPLVRWPGWRESALWWPEASVLVCADALGTARYFRAPGEPVGVHPFLRLTPPRRLARTRPLHILCGHGEGVHGEDVPALLDEALRTARRRLPAALLGTLRRH
jgi:hypothetical protein